MKSAEEWRWSAMNGCSLCCGKAVRRPGMAPFRDDLLAMSTGSEADRKKHGQNVSLSGKSRDSRAKTKEKSTEEVRESETPRQTVED